MFFKLHTFGYHIHVVSVAVIIITIIILITSYHQCIIITGLYC
jgi:hypothetical protein